MVTLHKVLAQIFGKRCHRQAKVAGQFYLVFSGPVQIRHFIAGPQIGAGIFMARQAPIHAQGLGLIYPFHVVHLTVTHQATDAGVDVGGMIKIDIIGQFINLFPGNWHTRHFRVSGTVTISKPLKLGTIRGNLGVTVHAGLRRWNGSKRGPFNIGMTVFAINTELTGVKSVAECHGLNGLVADV